MSDHDGAQAPLMLSVSGCRGIVGASFTPEVAARMARAFAGWLREERRIGRPRIAIGRDGRTGGEPLFHATIAALTGAGCDVLDLGVATTPTIGVVADVKDAHGGMVLTASHNPGQWNGLKCLVRSGDGAEANVGAHAPYARDAQRIIDRFRNGSASPPADAAQRGSATSVPDAAAIHVAKVLEAVAHVMPLDRIRARRFRVVVDSVNSSGAQGARLLLAGLDADLHHAHADGSGVFPHTPEPTAENLAGLSAIARDAGAAVSFAQDPDADRLAVLDEQGRYIGEEYTLVLAAMALGGGPFATNLSTSRMLDDVGARLNARVLRAAVGEANVVDAMAQGACPLGGEGNGGVIWPQIVWIRDSLGAMALTLALMTREHKTISQLVASTPSYVIEKRKLPFRPGVADQARDALARRWQGKPGVRIDTRDGLRADFDATRAWVHVRASNTEPIFRLIAEAPDAKAAAALLDEAESALRAL